VGIQHQLFDQRAQKCRDEGVPLIGRLTWEPVEDEWELYPTTGVDPLRLIGRYEEAGVRVASNKARARSSLQRLAVRGFLVLMANDILHVCVLYRANPSGLFVADALGGVEEPDDGRKFPQILRRLGLKHLSFSLVGTDILWLAQHREIYSGGREAVTQDFAVIMKRMTHWMDEGSPVDPFVLSETYLGREWMTLSQVMASAEDAWMPTSPGGIPMKYRTAEALDAAAEHRLLFADLAAPPTHRHINTDHEPPREE
jgi:hypothetical protein